MRILPLPPTSGALREAIAGCLREHESAPELWAACAHCADNTMNFALFIAVDDHNMLHCTFAESFGTIKAVQADEFFRALVFWRDASTDKTRPDTSSRVSPSTISDLNQKIFQRMDISQTKTEPDVNILTNFSYFPS